MKKLISEIHVSYKPITNNRVKISSSKTAYMTLKNLWSEDTIHLLEEVKILLLNKANEILGVYHLSKGGVSGAFVDIKLILSIALKANASGIILAHNHPSGNLIPSQSDILLTNKLKKGAEFLELVLLDHLIISTSSYYSFSDELKL